MAALAVVGLAAAWADHNRSDDVTGRSSLPLIGLTLSGDDITHFERIYARLVGDNPDYQFYRDHNRWRRAQLRYDGAVYNVRVKSHGREPHGHSVERDGQRFISLSVRMAPGDRVAGRNRFKLIVRENLIDAQPLVMPMAREAHLLLQDHRLVRVQINDSREKLFYFSNLLDDEYTEAAGHARNATVIANRSDKTSPVRMRSMDDAAGTPPNGQSRSTAALSAPKSPVPSEDSAGRIATRPRAPPDRVAHR